jgi:single-stranded-DNA-specific exonuclease
MLYRWVFKNHTNIDKIAELKSSLNINHTLAQLILDRSFNTSEEVEHFIKPSLSNLHDPFLFKDMDKAVNRLLTALREGENIIIYGDYDVDGITSVSLLYEALFELGGKVSFYIPNRISEGYGLSRTGIDVAKNRKVNLLITVDCGVTAVDEVKYANENNIDVIVCDHHEATKDVPPALAVINPKLKTSKYPFKELAGVGVAFKLLQALYQRLGYEIEKLEKFLDLVAVGTAADIVPLLDENRILVKFGLEKLNSNSRNGLFALVESASLLGRELTVSTIVFVMAPRINAVGRMSNAKKAVHLLTSKSLQQARNIAKILESENKMRRNIDEATCLEAINMVEQQIDQDVSKIIVLAKEDWHPGVIGIVASRIMEKFNRPAVLISLKEGIGKGSARSTLNFDIYKALNSINHLLEDFGGHKFAAGLTIKEENINELRTTLEKLSKEQLTDEDITPSLLIESEINLNQFDAKFLKWLKYFAPYGPENMKPVFVVRDLEVVGAVNLVGYNHLKMKVKQDGIVIDAIAYNFGDKISQFKKKKQKLDSAFVMEENTWNGQTTIQMRIRDFNLL